MNNFYKTFPDFVFSTKPQILEIPEMSAIN